MRNKRILKLLSIIFVVVLTALLFVPSLVGCKKNDKRVLLISIDGLRADAVANTEYGRYLINNHAYSLESTTVNPSVTLPCHTSMFYSVTPDVHGVTTNNYTPSEDLGHGIIEGLLANDKSSAMFYNWYEIGYLDKDNVANVSNFISGYDEGWEETNARLCTACEEHIENKATDFTFLYLGFLDEWGHAYGWLSDEYYYALNQSFAKIKPIIDKAIELDYTVIITTDHGGHDYTHGTTMTEDMTIPLFIVGEGYSQSGGKNLGARSILDVAPTVFDRLGVTAPDYWQGTAIK